ADDVIAKSQRLAVAFQGAQVINLLRFGDEACRPNRSVGFPVAGHGGLNEFGRRLGQEGDEMPGPPPNELIEAAESFNIIGINDSPVRAKKIISRSAQKAECIVYTEA